jgi:hypothetical protein
MARAGYMRGWGIEGEGRGYMEQVALAELHKKIPLKTHALLSHRLRTDLRWLGTDRKYSYRLRYRLMVEKEWQRTHYSVVPFLSGEAYWDSRYATVNRCRFEAGATYLRGARFGYEANLSYQYDGQSSVTRLYAVNLVLHLYFESRRSVKAAAPATAP